MSRDFSPAHLKQLELLRWSHVDSKVLTTCFSIVSGYSSVEELVMQCDTPGEHLLQPSPHAVHVAPVHLVGIIFFEWIAR